ncbi:MAG: glycerophosphodiester phosphodiesterase family protein [Microterricola sp.]
MKARVAAILATATSLALLNTLVLTPGAPDVYASDVFGSLRLPGDAAFIAGHRGDRSVAPENTIEAFTAAFENPSMQFVETDVQLSRDGVPMLFHDTTLKRVAGSPKRVADLSVAELKRLDVGAFYGEDFVDTRMPSLDEFLELAGGYDKRLLIELKADWSLEQLAIVVDALERSGVGSRVLLQSFSIETLQNLQTAAPKQPRMLLIRELPGDPVPMALRLGVLALGTTAQSVTEAPQALQRLHEVGIGVVCYTLNSERSWAEVQALGVDGIITDTPSDLDGWLADNAPGT